MEKFDKEEAKQTLKMMTGTEAKEIMEKMIDKKFEERRWPNGKR